MRIRKRILESGIRGFFPKESLKNPEGLFNWQLNTFWLNNKIFEKQLPYQNLTAVTHSLRLSSCVGLNGFKKWHISHSPPLSLPHHCEKLIKLSIIFKSEIGVDPRKNIYLSI